MYQYVITFSLQRTTPISQYNSHKNKTGFNFKANKILVTQTHIVGIFASQRKNSQ